VIFLRLFSLDIVFRDRPPYLSLLRRVVVTRDLCVRRFFTDAHDYASCNVKWKLSWCVRVPNDIQATGNYGDPINAFADRSYRLFALISA